jgi:hypothetical protein
VAGKRLNIRRMRRKNKPQVNFIVSAEEIAAFKAAAIIERRSMADFIRNAAWLRAQELIQAIAQANAAPPPKGSVDDRKTKVLSEADPNSHE